MSVLTISPAEICDQGLGQTVVGWRGVVVAMVVLALADARLPSPVILPAHGRAPLQNFHSKEHWW
jgi:hypothetical protein